MFCVLYSKDTRQKPGQSEQRSTDKQQRERERERERIKTIPVRETFSAPVHTGPGAHPASYKMGLFTRGRAAEACR